MKRRHAVAVGVAVLAAALAAGVLLRLSGADEPGEEEAAAEGVAEEVRASSAARAFAADVAVPVEGARVRQDTLVLWVEADGRAEARRAAPLRARVSGPVVEVPVQEGDAVEEGDLVARIDPAEYAVRVRRAEAELEQALADYRARRLGEEELGLDPEALEERRRQARIRAGVPTARASLDEARYQLRKTRIRAPFDGRVANLAVTEGTQLSQGDSVATVLDMSQVEVDVSVLQTRVAHLATGRRAAVRFAALPGESFPGRVVTINPMVDPESETVRVTVRLGNPEARVLPGMHATVRIAGRLHADRVFVPRDAVVERDRRDVVFVFEPDGPGAATGRARWRYVHTGLENERFVEIAPPAERSSQAEPAELVGAIVLVQGHATLTHDARVRLENREALSGHGASGGDGGDVPVGSGG